MLRSPMRLSAAMLACLAACSPSSKLASPHLSRALYWNTAPYGAMAPAAMTAAIDELKAQHVDRAHLWVNDQPSSTVTCATTFAPDGWREADVEAFAQRLKAAGIGVVLTVSPAVPTQAYIDSLQRLFAVARRTGAEIEYDLEGAWTTRFGPQTCGPGGTKPDLPAMELKLVQATRSATGGAVGLSTTPGHFADHSTLIAATDWVAPQLYDTPAPKMAETVRQLETTWKAKAVWPALRVDAPLETLIEDQKTIRSLLATDAKARGLAIWGRNELTYASRWLRDTP